MTRILRLMMLASCMMLFPAAGMPGVLAQSVEDDRESPRRVSLAYIADVHAQIEPHPELFWRNHDNGEQAEFVRDAGGLSRIRTVFERLRAERGDELLFLDGGDTIQGSGPAAWSEGRVVVEPTNTLGLDLGIPGNWSVIYGLEGLKQRAAEFEHPLIAANMFDAETGELLFEPYMVRDINGVTVGVVGYTDPDIPTRQPPHLSEGLKFEGRQILQPYIDEMRNEHGVDVVVVATHIGLPKAIRLAETLDHVDVVLSSDTHERTYEPIVRGDTWIVEAGAFASFVGVLDLKVDEGEIVDRAWRLIELRPELYEEHPETKAAVEQALKPHRERMNRVIGYTDIWLSRYEVLNTTLDNLIADAIREATGADVAMSNGFRFAPPTAPGPITVADLWTWLPLRPNLKTGEVRGERFQTYWTQELENVFSDDPERLFGGWLPRVSGMRVTFNRDAPIKERVVSLHVGEEPLSEQATYRVAAGNRKGAPEHRVHRVDHCERTRLLDMTTHDAVESYLRRHSPIQSTGERRVIALDTPPVLRSQTIDQSEAPDQAEERPVLGLEHDGPVRAVFQITADEWKDGVGKGLLYLRNLHRAYVKQGIDPERIELHAVYHGKAADHLLTDEAWNRHRDETGGNPNTQILTELAERGVSVELCETRRVNNGWAKSDVHEDVVLVGGAYRRIIDLQLQGFAYIRF